MKRKYNLLFLLACLSILSCKSNNDSNTNTSNNINESASSESTSNNESNQSASENEEASSNAESETNSEDSSEESSTNSESSSENEEENEQDKYLREFSGINKEKITTLGKVDRKIPVTKNEGLSAYPKYHEDFTNDELKASIYEENNSLIASPSTYDSMDKNGSLYLNGEATGKTLYKHSASIGLYDGNVLDTEQAYEKKIEISPRKRGNYITGCYAPAGEVIEIRVSEETLKNNPNLKVSIGQSAQNGSNNAIPQGNTLTRMPNITNTMSIKNETSYVGSYFGGPIYIDGINSNNKKVEVIISGAVEYATLLYGSTSKDEYERSLNSSAPYFDLEVFDKGVRHSGNKCEVKDYSYEDLIKAAKLWENIASISNQIPGGSSKDIGITFLYDTYVVYGVATAQIGNNYIQCYTDWLKGALDYEGFVKNGSWGHIHEYNHHFQDYIKLDSEATNNAISLIEYYMFTNISQNRTEAYPVAGDWNLFTDPYRSLSITNQNQSRGELHDELNEYADIFYSFGYEAFINACKKCSRVDNYDQWFKALCDETKYDMTYYFTKLINKPLSNDSLEYAKNLNYPTFVPAASLYQTGRVNNDKDIKSVLPFIVKGNSYTLDLNNYLVVPNGFNYSIKQLRANDNVTINKTANNIYDVSFTGNETGNIYLDIDLNNNEISTSVTLILELSNTYRDLDNITNPYKTSDNVNIVINSQNTTIHDYSASDGYYIMGTNDPQNLNNGDDVDILQAVNFEIDFKPYNITMNMNEVALVNTLTICQGFTSLLKGPSLFNLYGGKTPDDMELLGNYKISYINNYAKVSFEAREIQYFRLEVMAVGNDYQTFNGDVTLSRLEMSLLLGDGDLLSPFDSSIIIPENVDKVVDVESTFGYILSSEGSTISFNCEGSKLALLFKEGEEATIVIDEVEYLLSNSFTILDLSEGTHTVSIKGNYQLDSIRIIK